MTRDSSAVSYLLCISDFSHYLVQSSECVLAVDFSSRFNQCCFDIFVNQYARERAAGVDGKLGLKIKQVKSIDRERWLILASHPLRPYPSISVGWFLINGQLFRMLGWGLRQTSSNDSGGGGRAGTREWGRTRGQTKGGPMMMITITVILEGWKSRHALLLALIHSAADFSYERLHDQRYGKLFFGRIIKILICISYKSKIFIFVNASFTIFFFCMKRREN